MGRDRLQECYGGQFLTFNFQLVPIYKDPSHHWFGHIFSLSWLQYVFVISHSNSCVSAWAICSALQCNQQEKKGLAVLGERNFKYSLKSLFFASIWRTWFSQYKKCRISWKACEEWLMWRTPLKIIAWWTHCMIPHCCSRPQTALPALKGRKVWVLSFPLCFLPENGVRNNPFWQTELCLWTKPPQPIKSTTRHWFLKASKRPDVQTGAWWL